MVYLILGIDFGFLAPTIVIFLKTIKFNIYIERFMGVFIVYIDIIRPLFHFDYNNFLKFH
jgi:hypothetical protein